MKQKQLVKIVLTSLFIALIYVSTTLIQIPVSFTGGYVNFGDGIILTSAFLLGPIYSALAAGIGSALADLLSGYTQYALGTFVIKTVMALCVTFIYKNLKTKTKLATAIASSVGEIIMILGYFVYESIFLCYGWGALPSIIGNIIQGITGIVSSVLIYHALQKIPQIKNYFK